VVIIIINELLYKNKKNKKNKNNKNKQINKGEKT
jgi:hypothetical protein